MIQVFHFWVFKENKNTNLKRYTHLYVHCSIIYNSQDMETTYVLFLFINLFIYFWLPWIFVAACALFSSCGERGLLFIAVRGLLIAVASLVAEHGLQACGLQ